MSIIFRNGKYYDSEKEDIPEETQTVELKKKMSFIDKYVAKFKVSDYLIQAAKIEQEILEKKKWYDPYVYDTFTTDNTNDKYLGKTFLSEYINYYSYPIQDSTGMPHIITPKGGIWNDLIEYEYKKIAEGDKFDELSYQKYLDLLGMK